MKPPVFLPTAAVLFAAISLPTAAIAQSTNVKVPNKNQSAKFKSAIFKGSGNLIQSNSIASFIGGGQSNTIAIGVTNGLISGGFGNTVSGDWATIGAGVSNTAAGIYGVVSGGTANTAGIVGTVAGGFGNKADEYATVSGGGGNHALGYSATVSGGINNKALKRYTTIAGGRDNKATNNDSATVGGGQENEASGLSATVAGGWRNTASATYATIPGGAYASAEHRGSFVWSGDSEGGEVTRSFGEGTFTVRCKGGARFYTTASGILFGPRLAANGSDWVTASDSNLKTKVTAVDPREILAKLSRLPVTEWEYKHNPKRRYIGPMAQDFHAIFGLGEDDKGIGTLDSDGVMYAAIQGLVEELKERDKAMAARDETIEELKAELKAIKERLNSLPPAP